MVHGRSGTYGQSWHGKIVVTVLFALCVMATATLLGVGNVAAQESENRATARRLAIAGMDQADAGAHAAALPLLEKAEALYHAPVHLQYIARCHLRLGHLVRASETYRTLARERMGADAPTQFRDAQAEARRELALIEPRLGTLLLQPAPPEGSKVALDGHELSAAAIEAPLVIDPGPHKIVVRGADGRVAETSFEVREGGALTIALGPGAGPGQVMHGVGRSGVAGTGLSPSASGLGASGVVATATLGNPTKLGALNDSDTGRWWGALGPVGLVTASVGGVAMVGGLVTLGMRNAERDALFKACANQETECDPQHIPVKERVENLTTITNAFVFGGAALGILGASAWAFSKTANQKPHVSVAAAPMQGGGFVSATVLVP